MRKYLMLMLSVVMVVMVSACGEAEVSTVEEEANAAENEANNDANDSENNNENNAEGEDGEEFYQPDETVSGDGIEMRLDERTWGGEEEFVESDNGNLIRSDLTIKNSADDNEFVDDIDFGLYDEEGNKLDTCFGNDDANMFVSEIKKG